MKKYLFTAIGICLVFTMLLSTYGSASAYPRPTSGVPAPTVNPVSGDLEFETSVIGTASLPGVTTLDSGMLIPVGFPAGEKQFEGSAVRISKMDYGSANACFPFTGAKYGWGGQVGMWDGAQWKLLPTTITTPEESTISYACAAINGNGNYAFIKWVADKSLLPVKNHTCGYGILWLYFDTENIQFFDDHFTMDLTGVNIFTDGSVDLTGKSVTITIKDELPAGSIILPPLTGVLMPGSEDSYYFTLPSPASVYQSMNLFHATWVLDFGSCEETLNRSVS